MINLIKVASYFYKAAATANYNRPISKASISLIENALRPSSRFILDKSFAMVAFPFKGEETSEKTISKHKLVIRNIM